MKKGRRLRKTGGFGAVLVMAASVAICQAAGQAKPSQNKPAQNKPAQAPQQAPAPNPPAQGNPFPDDNGNIPVLPNATAPAPEPAPAEAGGPPPALPSQDVDPVRSPDEPLTETPADASSSSSSSADLARILEPPPDTDTKARRKVKNQPEPPAEHQETAKENEDVGAYYLEQKNWRAALSRYQSALVLDPENPDVYWGLAEAQRHLGEMANAKANYQKVMEYDPDSKHAKEAKKLLKEPELANAPAPAAPR